MRSVVRWVGATGGVIALCVVVLHFVSTYSLDHPAVYGMFGGYFSVLALVWLPRVAYRVQAWVLCTGVLVTASSAIWMRGAAPAPLIVLALAVICWSIFLGRVGLGVALVTSTCVVYALGEPIAPELYDARGAAIMYGSAVLALALVVTQIVRRIESALVHSQAALDQLREEQAKRSASEADLDQTRTALFQAQKMEAVGRLAGGVAHDFNNTLQVVLGWTELLRGETNPATVQEGIQEIQVAAERSKDLTRQLLAFGRPELQVARHIDITQFLRSWENSVRRVLPDDVKLSVRVQGEPAAWMDETHLNQVLLNLVVNARDAMPTGGVLEIGARIVETAQLPRELRAQKPFISGELAANGSAHASAARGWCEIYVRDEGVGMDEQTRRRVFEPFFSTKGDAGTGLGLSTVFGVLQQAHGAVVVDSELGVGTEFHIYLPLALQRSAEEGQSPEPAQADGSGKRVLLAEDDASVRSTLARALRAAGYDVVAVPDVPSALTALNDAEYHVLVSDGIMPGGSTKQLLDRFATAHPRASIVLCSGYLGDELAQRSLADGQFEHMPKPFPPSALLQRLSRLRGP